MDVSRRFVTPRNRMDVCVSVCLSCRWRQAVYRQKRDCGIITSSYYVLYAVHKPRKVKPQCACKADSTKYLFDSLLSVRQTSLRLVARKMHLNCRHVRILHGDDAESFGNVKISRAAVRTVLLYSFGNIAPQENSKAQEIGRRAIITTQH